MKCSNCGAEINDNAVFCPECGVKITDTPAAGGSQTAGNAYYNGQQNNQGYTGQPNNGCAGQSNNQGYAGQPGGQPYFTGAQQIPDEYTPISMWGYFGYEILFSIPIVF